MFCRTIVRGGLALLVLGALSAAPTAQPQTQPDPQAIIRSLEGQLAVERAHNQELTAELAKTTRELADTRRHLEAARAANIVISVQPGRPVPEGWTLRRFNGINYYLVPLNAQTDPELPPIR